jgi:hypothetical protein
MIAAAAWLLGLIAAGLRRAAARWSGSRARPEAQLTPQPGVRWARVTPEKAEQLLSAALVAGVVEQADYQRALEVLARVDDARRPLEVPTL